LMKGKNAYICNMGKTEQATLKEIPARIDNNEILQLINASHVKKGSIYFTLLKHVTGGDDKEISDWLSINEKTYRTYKVSNKTTKRSLIEHAIMLISLFKHGQEIFGTPEQFKKWLEKNNFYFDNKPPITFMETSSGIKFIDDRLTGLEYGDNA
jgi:uncharacterized protein (DUF2384 family)